jgi:hypothetical protein
VLPFRNHALEVWPADRTKQVDTSPLNMVEVQEAGFDAGNERLQSPLALEQGPIPEILTVDLQRVEAHEVRPLTAEQQGVELRAAVPVEADNFAVEDCLVGTHRMRKFFSELRELIDVTSARHEFTAMASDDGERSEAIVLELEHELLVVKRLGDSHQGHGVQGR